MGLIKKLSESYKDCNNKIKQRQSEYKKRKEFEKMLDYKLPCGNIIILENNQAQKDYFLVQCQPFILTRILEMGGRNIDCKFKQLTGENAGKVYIVNYPNSVTSSPFCYFALSPIYKSAIEIRLCKHTNYSVCQGWGETFLQEHYGEFISIRQLLMRWKTLNNQFMNINLESDYEMVKRLYDSEDILNECKTQGISK